MECICNVSGVCVAVIFEHTFAFNYILVLVLVFIYSTVYFIACCCLLAK